jgi:hypothetical protein
MARCPVSFAVWMPVDTIVIVYMGDLEACQIVSAPVYVCAHHRDLPFTKNVELYF